MSTDARIKRFFPVIVLSMIGLVAYLQARGIGRLISSGMSDPAPMDGAPVPTASSAPKEGQPILDQNPFDSSPATSSSPDGPAPASSSADERDEPDGGACGSGKVVLITVSDQPGWSFASVAGQDGEAKLRRVGDPVDDHEVDEITSDRVWLKKNGRRCFLQLGTRASVAGDDEADGPSEPLPSGAMPPKLAAQIKRLNAGEVTLTADVVSAIRDQPAAWLGAAKMRPERQGDRVAGVRLSQIRRGSLLDVLGLKNGDRLESINGMALTDPRKVMDAYLRLQTAERWSLRLVRGGAPRTIDYRVR